mmetsp:Transcript_6965/g.20433  ORF Transcript_6965/g.20433 Transcript_6965/m.20433 type:complete len:256 (-) Transcript_6965:1004-1771(-)
MQQTTWSTLQVRLQPPRTTNLWQAPLLPRQFLCLLLPPSLPPRRRPPSKPRARKRSRRQPSPWPQPPRHRTPAKARRAKTPVGGLPKSTVSSSKALTSTARDGRRSPASSSRGPWCRSGRMPKSTSRSSPRPGRTGRRATLPWMPAAAPPSPSSTPPQRNPPSADVRLRERSERPSNPSFRRRSAKERRWRRQAGTRTPSHPFQLSPPRSRRSSCRRPRPIRRTPTQSARLACRPSQLRRAPSLDRPWKIRFSDS